MKADPTKTRLSSNFLLSIAIHATVLLSLLMIGAGQTRQIHEWHAKTLRDLRQLEELAREEALRQEEELAKEMLRDEIMDQLREVVEETVAEEDEQKLLEGVDEELAKAIEDKTAGIDPQSLSEAAKDDLRKDALASLQDKAEQLQHDLILAEVRRHIREDVAPAVRDAVERNLEQQTGKAISDALLKTTSDQRQLRAKEASQAVKEAQAAVRQLKTAQAEVRNLIRKNPDEAAAKQNELAVKAKEVADEVGRTLEAVAKAVPRMASEAKQTQQQVSSNDARPAMEAAGKELAGKNAKEGEAKARQAETALGEQEKALGTLAQNIEKDSRSKEPDSIQSALAKAALASVQPAVKDTVGQKLSNEATQTVGKRVMDEVSKQLKLAGADDAALGKQIEKAVSSALSAELSGSKVDTSVAGKQAEQTFAQGATAQADSKAAAATAAQVTPTAVGSAAASVQSAAQNAKFGKAVSGAAASRLARLDDLGEKIAQIAKNMEQGRGLASPVSATKGTVTLGLNTGAADSPLSGQGDASQLGLNTGTLSSPLSSAGLQQGPVGQHTGDTSSPLPSAGLPQGPQGPHTGDMSNLLSSAGLQQGPPGLHTGSTSSPLPSAGLPQGPQGPHTGDTSSPLSSAGLQQGPPGLHTGNTSSPLPSAGLPQGPPGLHTGFTSSPLPSAGMPQGPPGLHTGFISSPLSSAGMLVGPPGLHTGGMGDGIPNSSKGEIPGVGDSYGAREGGGYNAYVKYNREVYNWWRKQMTERQDNPATSAVASEADLPIVSTVAAVSVGEVAKTKPARIFIESPKNVLPVNRSNTDNVDRAVVEPRFPTLAFGAAPYQKNPLTIDGDLGDWGKLSHPINMRWGFEGDTEKQLAPGEGMPLWMRWSANGLYFAYRVEGKTDVEIPRSKPYEGDLLEVFIDVDNLRKERMVDSPYTQQFLLMPFGYYDKNGRGGPETSFCEVGRGFRSIAKHSYLFDSGTDPSQALGMARARKDATGYTVEGFINRKALARPKLASGMYVAMNFSINIGYNYRANQQWSLSKAHHTYEKPDTWGDVLLLGTDAEAKFVDATDPSRPPQVIVAGDAIGVEVVDEDMNIDHTVRDKILVEVAIKNVAAAMYVVLEETGPDTGVFRGSFSTQPWDLPRRVNTLNIRAGRDVMLTYKDARTNYGETDRIVESAIQVGVPVYRLDTSN